MDWQERSRRLVGDDQIRNLEQAHVILFGLGGVGSFAAEALARSGLGALSLVEYDRVTDANRNRQLPALCSTVGREKIEVAGARLKDINPNLKLFCYPVKMTGDNLGAILDGQGLPLDFIADAIDDLPAKTALILASVHKGIPIISSMGAGFRLDPSQLAIGDILETHTCPLARKLRRNLREAGVGEGIPVVWSKEKPFPRLGDEGRAVPLGDQKAVGENGAHAAMGGHQEEEGRRGPASMIFVPAAAGLLMASYIVARLMRNG